MPEWPPKGEEDRATGPPIGVGGCSIVYFQLLLLLHSLLFCEVSLTILKCMYTNMMMEKKIGTKQIQYFRNGWTMSSLSTDLF